MGVSAGNHVLGGGTGRGERFGVGGAFIAQRVELCVTMIAGGRADRSAARRGAIRGSSRRSGSAYWSKNHPINGAVRP